MVILSNNTCLKQQVELNLNHVDIFPVNSIVPIYNACDVHVIVITAISLVDAKRILKLTKITPHTLWF